MSDTVETKVSKSARKLSKLRDRMRHELQAEIRAELQAEMKSAAKPKLCHSDPDPKSIYRIKCISCMPELNPDRVVIEDEHCVVVVRDDNAAFPGRCLVYTKAHIAEDAFWESDYSPVIEMCNKVARAMKKAFPGCTIVNRAQLGNLTKDHLGNPTVDQRNCHTHMHLIPRHEKPFEFMGEELRDPQYENGSFWPLNLDPKFGLPVMKPTNEHTAAMAKLIRDHME